MVYRNAVFPFYFAFLGVAAFSFSPALVLWAGLFGALSWLVGFFYVISDMSVVYEWGDMPSNPTRADVEQILLQPNFVGTGSRIQESLGLIVTSLLISVVVWRARRTVHNQLIAERERARIQNVFGQYVPSAITAALVADEGVLQPIERTATVVFVDVANFTTMTERLGSTQTIAVLNDFFDMVTKAITDSHGVVTQFQGDALLATFNVPVADAGHATHALDAALAINRAVATGEFGGTRLRARIGVSTGSVSAGSVGGGGRQNYTVHGDAVNAAARLEGLNKTYGTEILLSAATVSAMPQRDFQLIDTVEVRGFESAIAVYTPK